MILKTKKIISETLIVLKMMRSYKMKSSYRRFDGTWSWSFSWRTQPYISYRVQTQSNNKKEALMQLQKTWNL